MEDTQQTTLDLLIRFGFVETLDDVRSAVRSNQVDIYSDTRHWFDAQLGDDASWATGIRYGRQIRRFSPDNIVIHVGAVHG